MPRSALSASSKPAGGQNETARLRSAAARGVRTYAQSLRCLLLGVPIQGLGLRVWGTVIWVQVCKLAGSQLLALRESHFGSPVGGYWVTSSWHG